MKLARSLLFFLAGFLAVDAQTLQNSAYTVTLNGDASVSIATAGVAVPHLLQPEFAVMFSATAPGFNENHSNYYLAPRTSILWTAYKVPLEELNTLLNNAEWRKQLVYPVQVTEDAAGARKWTYYATTAMTEVKLEITGIYAQGTTDPFRIGTRHTLRASAAAVETSGGVTRIRWTFDDDQARPFTFSADLTLPSGNSAPVIATHLTARNTGYFMTAFTGAPPLSATAMTVAPQEALGLNSKLYNHVVCEGDLKLPRAQVTSTAGWSSALAVDPSESLFVDANGNARVPDRLNSRFGVMLERTDGLIKPLIFAPLSGGAESLLTAGTGHDFKIQYVLRPGTWRDLYRDIAQISFGLDDPRDNTGTGSLNRTFDRVMDYLADRNGKNYAMWHAEQKYYDYFSDQPNSFKPFSPLYGLAAAIITDDEDFYWRRALPQVEFGISRTSNTFVPYDTEDTGLLSNPSRGIGAPYMSAVQLASLHWFYQQRVSALRTLAETKGFSTSIFPTLIVRHALTGVPADYTLALTRANSRLNSDPSGLTDHYMDWLDLWEASGATPAQRDPRFLAAAINGAYAWVSENAVLSPAVPAGDVVIDRGGVAPVHAHSLGRWPRWGFPTPVGYPTPEQTVPAWRVALNGLSSSSYRGEFWMDNHGHLMRLSALAAGGDSFLRSVSRWGMVGRFANYPGDNRSMPSLVVERPELPDNPMWLLSHTTMNPGHAWELAGEILDFMVSNFFALSGGAIDFPSRSMYGGAFRVRLYGDRPGTFHGDTGVRLWMPRGLAQPSNPQIDYLSGYGNGRLYIAFINQAASEQTVSVTFDGARVGTLNGNSARRWVNNGAVESTALVGNGLAPFTIPTRGIVAFAIDGVTPRTTLQRRMLDPAAPRLGPAAVSKQGFTVRGVAAQWHGYLLSLGRGLTNAFVYTDLSAERVISARLHFRQGDGAWQQQVDEIFPFEFSLPVAEGRGAFQAYLELTVPDAEQGSVVVTSPQLTLAAENDYANFAASSGLNVTGQGGALADADGDGVNNLLEFFLGSDPTVSDGPRLPELRYDAGVPVIEFTRRNTAAAMAFDVQMSFDLATWMNVAGSEDEHLFEIAADTANLERLSLRLLPNLDRVFLRLRVVNE